MSFGTHVLQRRGPRRWPPGIFGNSCNCSCSSGYNIKQFDNDSALAELARVDDGNATYSLEWNGTYLYSNYGAYTSGGGYIRAKSYDNAMAFVQSFTYTYSYAASGNRQRAMGICGDGTVCLNANRNTTVNRNSAVSRNSDDSADWETAIDATGSGMDAVAGDSSGNVYALAQDTGGMVIYKFDSAGVKQWKTTIAVNRVPRGLLVDATGNIWAISQFTTTAYLDYITSAGAISTTVTIANWNPGHFCTDGSTGIWVSLFSTAFPTPATPEIRNYSSAGALGTTITEADLFNSLLFHTGPVAFDGTDVVAVVRNSSLWKVRKYRTAGVVQWTSGDIGWTSLLAPFAIKADANYIFVGGSYIP